MSEHPVKLQWNRATPDFDLKSYNRGHDVTFKNGQTVTMSSAVAYRGDADAIDPEEMFVASLASCHMLTFLALAAGRKFTVDSYSDDPVGHAEKNEKGRNAVTRVTLRPKVAFSGESPDDETLHELHEEAHEKCFIANSVCAAVDVRPEAVQSAAAG
jgi:organic hydroperoxide reductase OsmC/OhrA